MRSDLNKLSAKYDTMCTSVKEYNVTNKKIESLLKSVGSQLTKFNNNAKNDKIAYSNIMVKLNELATFVTEQRLLKQIETIITFEKFITMHNLTLPLEEPADFESFDNKLGESSQTVSEDLVSF